jgi:hypothetical protein
LLKFNSILFLFKKFDLGHLELITKSFRFILELLKYLKYDNKTFSAPPTEYEGKIIRAFFSIISYPVL